MLLEDGEFYDALKDCGNYLKHMHHADTGRTMPGTGNVDFKLVIGVLEEIIFTKYISLDCLPTIVPVDQYLKHSISYMRTMEDAWDMTRKIRTEMHA